MRLLPILLTASVLFASSVGAQSPKAAAESLYDEGRKLMQSSNFAEACAKFEESQRLDPGSGTQLNLAHCLEKLGKTASAWAEYREAAATARAAIETARQQLAEKGAADLEAGLSKVRISAPDGLAGLEIHLDGVALGAGSLGAEIPVDPGDHTLEATAPGHVPYKSKLTVGPNGDRKVVTIPPLAVSATSATATPGPTQQADQPAGWGTQRTAGVVMGGVGVVGIVVGAVFGAQSMGKKSDSNGQCEPSNPNLCNTAGVAFRDQAYTDATVSTVGFIAGAALLVGGTVLFLTAPHSKTSSGNEKNRAFLQKLPSLGAGLGSISVRGAW